MRIARKSTTRAKTIFPPIALFLCVGMGICQNTNPAHAAKEKRTMPPDLADTVPSFRAASVLVLADDSPVLGYSSAVASFSDGADADAHDTLDMLAFADACARFFGGQ